MYTIELPTYSQDLLRVRSLVTLQAETISGLVVHRDSVERGWVVSTKALLAVCGGPAGGTAYLGTRAQARHAARAFAPLLPDQVKSGKWNGAEWLRRDPDMANAFRDAQRLYRATV
jgi:hypothetical protein